MSDLDLEECQGSSCRSARSSVSHQNLVSREGSTVGLRSPLTLSLAPHISLNHFTIIKGISLSHSLPTRVITYSFLELSFVSLFNWIQKRRLLLCEEEEDIDISKCGGFRSNQYYSFRSSIQFRSQFSLKTPSLDQSGVFVCPCHSEPITITFTAQFIWV